MLRTGTGLFFSVRSFWWGHVFWRDSGRRFSPGRPQLPLVLSARSGEPISRCRSIAGFAGMAKRQLTGWLTNGADERGFDAIVRPVPDLNGHDFAEKHGAAHGEGPWRRPMEIAHGPTPVDRLSGVFASDTPAPDAGACVERALPPLLGGQAPGPGAVGNVRNHGPLPKRVLAHPKGAAIPNPESRAPVQTGRLPVSTRAGPGPRARPPWPFRAASRGLSTA